LKSYPTGGSSAILGLHLGACSLHKNVFFSVYNVLFLKFLHIKNSFISYAIVKPRAV
jgi:hypothetical protein